MKITPTPISPLPPKKERVRIQNAGLLPAEPPPVYTGKPALKAPQTYDRFMRAKSQFKDVFLNTIDILV